MAFTPPNCVLEIMDKIHKDEELTEGESKLLSAYSKSLKSSNVGSSGIFYFLGGFVSSYFIGNSKNDK